MIDYKTILSEQKKVDWSIIRKNHLLGMDYSRDEILALIVEIGEFAQEEQKRWKYWKQQASENRDKALEEYADGIHFFASLAIRFHCDKELFIDTDVIRSSHAPGGFSGSLGACLYNLMNAFYSPASTKSTSYMKNMFKRAWIAYLSTGISELHFSDGEIQNAYFKKAKVNHKRQEEGY